LPILTNTALRGIRYEAGDGKMPYPVPDDGRNRLLVSKSHEEIGSAMALANPMSLRFGGRVRENFHAATKW